MLGEAMLPAPDLRVSDADRDEAVELLREHRMTGRLDAEEHEERVAEACGARYGRDLEHALRELPLPAPPPAPPGPPVFVAQPQDSGSMAIGFGVLALVVLLFTGGIGSILALPLAGTAWVLATRSAHHRGLRLAVTATALSVLALVLWTLWAIVGVAAFGA